MEDMWMVRAGPGAFLKEDFKKYNLVAIGWNIGDLTDKSLEEVRQLYYDKYKNYKSVKQVYNFVNNIKVGDYVITSLTWDTHSYLLGKITSDYYRSETITKTDEDNDNYFDVRDVEWLCEIVKFDLKKSTRKHLGLVSTVYEINENAKKDILKNVSKKHFTSNLKRNLIYFGAPGTGKSYNLNQDKNKLLENYEDNYERVTFHPDYFYANFVGTYKGVFPMDTAFKRRWDFKYFGINHNENLIEDTHVIINDKPLNWNDLRKSINDELLSYNINEDKLIGPFFAFNEYMNQKIELKTFKDVFKNKIIMYLFEDAARSRRNQLFSGACNIKDTKNITYFELCELIDDNKITEVFSNNFLDDEEEDNE